MGLILEARSPPLPFSLRVCFFNSSYFKFLVATVVVTASSQKQETGIARLSSQMDQTSL